jgi:hypothetical protein
VKRRPHESLEKLLNQASVDYLQNLVALGCNKAELIGYLGSIEWANRRETWGRLTGMLPKRLREVTVKNLRKIAEEVASLNSKLGFFLEEMGHPNDYRRLPILLLDYAKDLETLSRTGGEKRHPLLRDLKCELVRYVKEKTGRICDNEVSGLLSDCLNDPSYDATSHHTWRRKYCKM